MAVAASSEDEADAFVLVVGSGVNVVSVVLPTVPPALACILIFPRFPRSIACWMKSSCSISICCCSPKRLFNTAISWSFSDRRREDEEVVGERRSSAGALEEAEAAEDEDEDDEEAENSPFPPFAVILLPSSFNFLIFSLSTVIFARIPSDMASLTKANGMSN